MMSLRPGIGAWSASSICEALPIDEIDAPTGLRHGKSVLPLGRYITGKVKDELGLAKSEEVETKVLDMLTRSKDTGASIGDLVRADGEAAFRRLQARERIFKKKAKL